MTLVRDRAMTLPAALEIVETPASPTLRLTAAPIVLFLTNALAWSYVGRVDIIATAPGRNARSAALRGLGRRGGG